jgi:hypothetical protein
VGKFSDAVSSGQKEPVARDQNEAAAKQIREEATKAAHEWIDNVVLPVVERANADLNAKKLEILETRSYHDNPGVRLDIRKTDTPHGGPIVASLAFNVLRGTVTLYQGNERGRPIGTTYQVASSAIEALLIQVLQKIGTEI